MPIEPRLYRTVFMSLVLTVLAACDSGPNPEEALENARAAFAEGQLGSTMVQLKTLLQRNPDYAPARALLGEAALIFGEGASALKELGNVVNDGNAEPHVLYTYARALLLNGEYDEALRFAEAHADAIPAMVIQGEANLGLGRPEAAKAAFEAAIETDKDAAAAHLGLSRLDLAQNALDEARKHVEAALQLAPDDVDAWLMAGNVATAQHDYERGEAAFDKVLVLDRFEQSRYRTRAHTALAMIELFRSDPDAALPHIKLVGKVNPNHPRYRYLNALWLFEKGRLEEAQTELLEVLKQIPAHADALTMSGVVAYRRGDLNQAREYLERALVARPGSSYVRKSLGAIYTQLGQGKDALDMLEPLAKVDPKDAELQRMLGGAYLAAGRPAEATAALERAMRLAPEDLSGVTGLALGYLAEGESDKAISELSAAVEGKPDFATGKYLIAVSELQKGNLDAALAAARQLVDEKPDDALYANLLGVILRARNETDEARASFERALASDPNYVVAVMNLARLDITGGDWDAAEKQLEHVLEIDPAHAGALNALAARRYAQGQFDAAAELLERLRAARPKDLASRLRLAQILFLARRYDDSLEVAREALALAPDDLQANLLAARGELFAGNLETARNHARAALKRAPDMFDSNYLAGLIELRLGNEADARDLLRKATAIAPEAVMARDVLSRIDPGGAGKAGPTAVDAAIRLRELASGKHVEQALAAARAHAAAHPDDPNAPFLLAAAHMSAGDVAAARAQLEQVLNEQPDNLAAMINLARVEIMAGQADAARGWYRKVLEHEPNHIAALLDLAQLSPPEEAGALLRRAYAADPRSDATMSALIEHDLDQGDYAGAEPILADLYRRAPFDGNVLNLAIRTYIGLGKMLEAAAAADTFVERYPERADAHLLHGVTYYLGGDNNLARRALTKAIELEPSDTSARELLARIEFDAGNFDAASAQLDQLHKLGYVTPQLQKLEADIAWRSGRRDEALTLYRQAWEATPGYDETLALARAEWSTGARDAAHRLLSDALEATDAQPGLHEALGDMYYAEDDYAQAAEQYASLLSETPDNALVADKLAEVYDKLGDARALETARRANELAPDEPQVQATFGWLQVKAGRVERGIALLERALKGASGSSSLLSPTERATTRFQLATAYRRNGDKNAARRELTALLESGIEFPERDAARRLLEQ